MTRPPCTNCGGEDVGRLIRGRCRRCYHYIMRLGTDRPLELEEQRAQTNGLHSGAATAEIAGLTYRQLDYAAREGVIEPTVQPLGSGTRRGFTVDEVAAATVLSWLIESIGLPSIEIRKAMADRCRAGDSMFTVYHHGVLLMLDLDAARAHVRSFEKADAV